VSFVFEALLYACVHIKVTCYSVFQVSDQSNYL